MMGRAGMLLAAAMLACSLIPAQAHAYYDRGAVGVQTGVASLNVAAGETANVTVNVTPASDEQTVGCGMPKCPQGCAASCADANGQCTCGGTEYSTYYPSVVAESSNSGVATATVEGGTLTVYGRHAGTATITVRASLRQFSDGVASIEVTVEGEAPASTSATFGEVALPESADDAMDDRLDIDKRTVMGRPVWYVQLGSSADPLDQLSQMAGTDGEVVFWQGDTSYHPEYSMTFVGTNYAQSDLSALDLGLSIEREATGELTQPLADAQDFAVLRFAQQGAFPCAATVYALVDDVFADDAPLALFSYDSTNRAFVKEDIEVAMSGGYAVFTTEVGKTYVLSSQDLSSAAGGMVSGTASQVSGGCCTSDACAANATGDACACPTPGGIPVAIIAAIALIVIAAAVVAVIVVRRRKGASGAGAVAGSGLKADADAKPAADAKSGADAAASDEPSDAQTASDDSGQTPKDGR